MSADLWQPLRREDSLGRQYTCRSPVDRFFAKVEDHPDGCWIWIASLNPTGYGQFMFDGRPHLAHRWAYALMRAEIPDGLVLDHLCRTPACVNPWHLEPVTDGVNFLRGEHRSALTNRTGVCQRGHDMSAAYRIQGVNVCRPCRLESNRAWRARQKEQSA